MKILWSVVIVLSLFVWAVSGEAGMGLIMLTTGAATLLAYHGGVARVLPDGDRYDDVSVDDRELITTPTAEDLVYMRGWSDGARAATSDERAHRAAEVDRAWLQGVSAGRLYEQTGEPMVRGSLSAHPIARRES